MSDKIIDYNLDVPFKEFMPGQIIQSVQFNDNMKDVEEKVNEVIFKHNLLVTETEEHLDNIENPHSVTAHQVGTYITDEIDEFVESLRNAEFYDKSVGNRVLEDESVDTRVIKNKSITAIKVDDAFGNQIDISKNMSITDRYTKEEVNNLLTEKVGEGTYSKEEINQMFEDVQAGQIVDKTIGIDKLKDNVGRLLDISANKSITDRYTKEEVDVLVREIGLPRDWGGLEEIVEKQHYGHLPVANVMTADEFVAPLTSVLDIDVREVVGARNGYDNLGERLNSIDSQLEHNMSDINEQFNTIENKTSGFINAKNFGVVGDGVTDDTLNLQKAIDYCNTNKMKLYLNKGKYKITSPLNIYHSTEIEGNGMFNTVICAYHVGNAIQFKNGFVESEGVILDWGTAFQGKLSNFGITNKVEQSKDSLNRFLSFNEGNAIHLEGARYMAKLTNIRVNGGYKTGYYLFGSYGVSLECCEVNGVGNGIVLDRACNGVKIDKFYAKSTGFITNVSSCSAIKVLSSTNVNIVSPIIEGGVGSSAIIIQNCINVTIQNGYFERQTTNDRTIIINNSHSVILDNSNFENTLGCQFKNSYNLTFNKLSFFGNANVVTSNILAIKSTGENDTSYNINVNDCYYSINRNTTDVNAIPNLGIEVKLLPNENSAVKFREKDLFIIDDSVNLKSNLFTDGIFKAKTTGTLYSGTTGEVIGNVLELTLKNEGYSFTTFDTINYIHNSKNGNNLYLIVKAETMGDVPKSISIRPDSGSNKVLELPSTTNGEVRYFITRVSPIEGTTYNIRVGKLNTETSSILNKIKVHEIYFGFAGLKYLV